MSEQEAIRQNYQRKGVSTSDREEGVVQFLCSVNLRHVVHPGHIKVLVEARAACDRLIVGLNSDPSAARLKGDGRPIQNEKARAEVLAALEAVDLVVIFGEDTPLALIEKVRPSVLVKGGDYRPEEVVGREVVEANGGEVIIVASVPGHSTTALVGRSRSREPQRGDA